MKERFDFRELQRQTVEDEKVSKNRPVLLTQREIKELLLMRKAKDDGRRKP